MESLLTHMLEGYADVIHFLSTESTGIFVVDFLINLVCLSIGLGVVIYMYYRLFGRPLKWLGGICITIYRKLYDKELPNTQPIDKYYKDTFDKEFPLDK